MKTKSKRKIHPRNDWFFKFIFLSAIALVGLLLLFLTFSQPPISTTNWKTYTNPIKSVTIQYPPTWTVKESHTLNNRVVDNPKEINTAVLSGKEGEITIEWGPMGFGGGCDPKYHKTFKIQEKNYDICNIVEDNGDEIWAPFSNGAKDDSITEVVLAKAYKPANKNSQTVKAVLSTINFTNP